MSFKCEVCGDGMDEGISLFRVNPTGESGVWRCKRHLNHIQESEIDSGVLSVVNAIEKDNRDNS